MKHLFVPYAIAKLLKEKGFNEPCFGFYYTNPSCDEEDRLKIWHCEYMALAEFEMLAPTYQQVLDWFRIKHKIIVTLDYMIYPLIRYVIVTIENDKPVVKYRACYTLNHHEDALDYAIDDVLEKI